MVGRISLPGVKGFARVSRSLYRGAQPSRSGFMALRALGIRTIVNLRYLRSDRRAIAGLGFRYVHIHANAWHPEDEDFVAFLRVLGQPANHPVFVHCMHGVDRTGLAVAIYRMVVQGWSREAAGAEMMSFGFHRIWKHSIGRYLNGFPLAAFRRTVRSGLPPVPEIVP